MSQLDCVLRKDENYYSPVFLKWFKNIGKKRIKVIRHITGNQETFSNDSDEE